MHYRELGSTGIKISEIGFGSWGLGGDAYGPIDERDAINTLIAAYDKGLNYFDTSDGYGNGRSEELIGTAFDKIRPKVIIATKGGTLPHNSFDMPQDFSPQYLRRALESSLLRLKTDYVDLYQLALPKIQDLERNDAILAVLQEFKTEGKIRAIGISARSPSDALVAIEKFGFEVVQLNFSLIDQRALDIGLFDKAKKCGVGIAIRTPLAFGYLTGKLTGDESFESNDHRARWPQAQLRLWAESSRLFSSVIGDVQRSYAQFALQFCLTDQAVSTVMPDMMCIQEVEENAMACALPRLTEREIASVRHIYKNNTFYDPLAKRPTNST